MPADRDARREARQAALVSVDVKGRGGCKAANGMEVNIANGSRWLVRLIEFKVVGHRKDDGQERHGSDFDKPVTMEVGINPGKSYKTCVVRPGYLVGDDRLESLSVEAKSVRFSY